MKLPIRVAQSISSLAGSSSHCHNEVTTGSHHSDGQQNPSQTLQVDSTTKRLVKSTPAIHVHVSESVQVVDKCLGFAFDDDEVPPTDDES